MVSGSILLMGTSPHLFFMPMLAPLSNNWRTTSCKIHNSTDLKTLNYILVFWSAPSIPTPSPISTDNHSFFIWITF
jgi:hypothetical protein